LILDWNRKDIAEVKQRTEMVAAVTLFLALSAATERVTEEMCQPEDLGTGGDYYPPPCQRRKSAKYDFEKDSTTRVTHCEDFARLEDGQGHVGFYGVDVQKKDTPKAETVLK
jgi:hypothetical protein